MSTPRRITAAFLFVLLAVSQAICATPLTFTYQGRVKVGDQPYTGIGQFKFALVNTSGTRTLWSNDASSSSGLEPSTHVNVSVNNGIFTVCVGEPAQGMEPLPPGPFLAGQELRLRTWFSDGIHPFERLEPDSPVQDFALRALRGDTKDFTIYVNANTGDDSDNGLTTESAKASIQAAVEMIPKNLTCNVTIDVADGVYREEVMIMGIHVQPGKHLTILGDETWTPALSRTPSVRITGTDQDTTPTRERETCIHLSDSSGIALKGLLLDYAKTAGLQSDESRFQASFCMATYNGGGFLTYDQSCGELERCVAKFNIGSGFQVHRSSRGKLRACSSTDNQGAGLHAYLQAGVEVKETGDFSRNGGNGVYACFSSTISFWDGTDWYVRDNRLYGLVAGAVGLITAEGTVHHTGNTPQEFLIPQIGDISGISSSPTP